MRQPIKLQPDVAQDGEPAAAASPRPAARIDELALLAAAVRIVRTNALLLAVLFMALLIVGAAYARFADRVYTSRMIITVVEEDAAQLSGGGFSQLLRRTPLGGGATTPEFAAFRALLESRVVAERLSGQLLPLIFEARWDEASRTWRRTPSLRGRVVSALAAIIGIDAPPDLVDAESLRAFLDKNMSITEIDDDNAQYEIAVKSNDPEISRRVLLLVFEEADTILKDQKRERLERQIESLGEKLKSVATVENRGALISILTYYERQLIPTQIDVPLAARIIDVPNLPDRPTFPSLLTPVIVAAGGLFLAALMLSMLAMWAAIFRPGSQTLTGEKPLELAILRRMRSAFARPRAGRR